MRDRPINFKSAAHGGGPLEVRVIAGFANFCEFRLTLWDSNGKNPNELTHQTNVDSTPDLVSLPPPPDMVDRHIITYEAKIASFVGGPTQFSFIIELWQDGAALPDPIEERGPLAGGTFVFGGVRLMAA